jgi:hypothetical protein
MGKEAEKIYLHSDWAIPLVNRVHKGPELLGISCHRKACQKLGIC